MVLWLSQLRVRFCSSFLRDRGWLKAINHVSDKREAGEEFHSSAHANMPEMRALAYDKVTMCKLSACFGGVITIAFGFKT